MFPPTSMTESKARDEAAVRLAAALRLVGHGGRDDVAAAMTLVIQGYEFLALSQKKAA